MKLTKSRVESLPTPSEGQAFHWDDELRGFGVRVTATGARSYIAQGRAAGKTHRVTLGAHGRLTCDEARRKARLALIALTDGKDPRAEKKRTAALGVTLREVMEGYFRDRTDLKASTKSDIEKHVTRSLAEWADRPIASLTRDACAVRFRELTERGPAQANQAFRILRALLNYARAAYRTPEGVPTLPENPVAVLSETKLWNRVTAKSRRIPNDRVGKVWNLLQERRTDGLTTIGRTAADAVCFLLLTGARWNEAAELTWDSVNLEDVSWHMTDPKNRNPVTLALPPPALAILNNRPRVNDYVFPARSTTGHLSDARATMAKVSEIAGLHLSPHDLRRTFRAVAGECGIELWKTKLLLNHVSTDVTITNYTETSDLRYLAPEVEKIAAWIEKQAALAAAGNVVQMTARA